MSLYALPAKATAQAREHYVYIASTFKLDQVVEANDEMSV